MTVAQRNKSIAFYKNDLHKGDFISIRWRLLNEINLSPFIKMNSMKEILSR